VRRAALWATSLVFVLGCRQILGIVPAETTEDAATDSAPETPGDTPADDGADGGNTMAERILGAENACARLTGCSRGVGAMDFRSCVQRHLVATVADVSGHPLKANLWKCIDAASSCADIHTCTSNATAPTACSAAPTGTVKVCAGDSVTTCSGKTNVGAELCALLGQSCASLSSTAALCAGSSDCSAGTTGCSAARLLNCDADAGVDKGQKCDVLGGVCATSSGSSGCTGDDAPCGGATISCEGTVMKTCRFGREARFDCAALGSTCDPGGTGDVLAGCRAAATVCKDTDAPTCDAGKIRYCLGGTPRLVDCGAAGLGACAETPSLAGVSVACQ
jgi:hypothetical protein